MLIFRWIYVTAWNYLLLAWKLPFSISYYNICQLAINFVLFVYLVISLLFQLHFWKVVFLNIKFLASPFFLRTFNISPYCLLTPIISDEDSAVYFISCSIACDQLFSSLYFHDLLFAFTFQYFHYNVS
jgi:hypothetical protein